MGKYPNPALATKDQPGNIVQIHSPNGDGGGGTIYIGNPVTACRQKANADILGYVYAIAGRFWRWFVGKSLEDVRARSPIEAVHVEDTEECMQDSKKGIALCVVSLGLVSLLVIYIITRYRRLTAQRTNDARSGDERQNMTNINDNEDEVEMTV
jgi:hypothetical protein